MPANDGLMDAFFALDRERPTQFFKYMSASTARIVLENSTLRWSTPALLNDPFDVQFDLQFSPDPDRLLRLALDQVWAVLNSPDPRPPKSEVGKFLSLLRASGVRLERERFEAQFGPAVAEGLRRLRMAVPDAQAEIRTHLAEVTVLCLTETSTNNLMWAHYAQGGAGVVLRFRSDDVLDSAWRLALPVNYVDAVPQLFTEEHLAAVIAGVADMPPPDALRHQLFTKSSAWAYEREWRLCGGTRRGDQPFEDIAFHPAELDAVILGFRMSADDRAWFRDATVRRYPHAELLEAVPDPRTLGFEIRPLGA